MSTAAQAIKALQDLKTGIVRIAGDCMMEHQQEITGLLVHQQYDEGVDSTGRELRQYTRNTKQLKQAAGTYKGYTNLHETGEFHSTMMLRVDADNNTFEINSPSRTDQGELKSDRLYRWNKAPIMNLTPENMKLVLPIIEDSLRGKINSQLALD